MAQVQSSCATYTSDSAAVSIGNLYQGGCGDLAIQSASTDAIVWQQYSSTYANPLPSLVTTANASPSPYPCVLESWQVEQPVTSADTLINGNCTARFTEFGALDGSEHRLNGSIYTPDGMIASTLLNAQLECGLVYRSVNNVLAYSLNLIGDKDPGRGLYLGYGGYSLYMNATTVGLGAGLGGEITCNVTDWIHGFSIDQASSQIKSDPEWDFRMLLCSFKC